MYSKELLLITCLGMLGGFRFTSTTTTTNFVAAMSIGNQDLERYFRSTNVTQTLMEDRILLDTYAYAFLNYTDENNNPFTYDKEQARYGEGQIHDVKGKLIHISDEASVEDDSACSPTIRGTNGGSFPPANTPWIALVQRGHCTFEEKVKNVYAKGAIGVIIYNDKPVMNLEKMHIKGKHRNITAVITFQHIGEHMAEIADGGADMTAAITQGDSGTRPINNFNRTSVLFVSISFIVLMVISLVWLLFYYIQRFRYLQNKDQQSRQLCSVTKKAIMKIPTKTGKHTDEKDLDSDCCAICIETYKPSDTIRVLPCKHEFHKNCIDPWLLEHRTCPMCKLDVLKFYGYVVGDQIYSTPSPQHVTPNLVSPHNDNEAPAIVYVVGPVGGDVSSQMPDETSSTVMADAHNSNSINNHSNRNNCNNSSTSSCSNDSCNQNCSHSSCSAQSSCYGAPAAADEDQLRRNSAPILQVTTASRQVTDV